ncbi:hypothetical protein FRC17_009241 [Serendipita sp. 399]|nr:hypothetical protein FRC17_009241 [Serendipita sp. 399]
MDDPRYSYSIQDSYTWSGEFSSPTTFQQALVVESPLLSGRLFWSSGALLTSNILRVGREDGQQHAQVASQQQFLRHVMNSEDSAARSGPSQAPFPAAMGSPVPTRNYYDYSPPAYGSPNTFITHPQLRPTVIPSQPLSALYSPSASPAAQPQTLVPEPVLSGSHGIGGSTSLIPGTSAAYYPDPVAAGFEKRQYAPSARTTLSEYKAPLTGPPAGSADTRRRASREQAEGIGLVDRPTSTQVHQSSNVSGPEETLSLAEHSLPNYRRMPSSSDRDAQRDDRSLEDSQRAGTNPTGYPAVQPARGWSRRQRKVQMPTMA